MSALLLIIDVQKGFIGPSTDHVPGQAETLQEEFDTVIVTRFVNPPDSPYRQWIGWQRFGPGSDDIELAFTPRADALIIDKSAYTCVTPDFISMLKDKDINRVDICGIATDNCVLKCAIDLFEAGVRPSIHIDACGSHGGPECHAAGILVMRRMIGDDQLVEYSLR